MSVFTGARHVTSDDAGLILFSITGVITMSNNEQAILTVVGKNEIGILAKVATAVADAHASVVQVSQIVMGEFFTMNMHIEVTSMNCTIHQLEENIKAVLPGVEVHVMHENIFTSMHSI